jgi:RNA polymerase sigma factor (sigma-70 family)
VPGGERPAIREPRPLHGGRGAGHAEPARQPRAVEGRGEDILALHEALEALAERSPRQARIVELRVFSGQTTEEVAELLEIAPATVKADWAIARAWLKARLAQ